MTPPDFLTFQAITTLLVFVVLLLVCAWCYRPGSKQASSEAANLPFADDDADQASTHTSQK